MYLLLPITLLSLGMFAFILRTQQRQYYNECRRTCEASGAKYVDQIVLPPLYSPACHCVRPSSSNPLFQPTASGGG